MNQATPQTLREDISNVIKNACINGTASLEAEADILYDLMDAVVTRAHPHALTVILESLRQKLADGAFQDNPDTPFVADTTLTQIHNLLTHVGGGQRVLANLIMESAPLSGVFADNLIALPEALDAGGTLGALRIQADTKGRSLDPHFLLQRTINNETYLNIMERLPENALEPVRVRILFGNPKQALHAASQDAFKVAAMWLLAEQVSDSQAFTFIDSLTFPASHEAAREESDTTMSDYSDYIVRLHDGRRASITVTPTAPF